MGRMRAREGLMCAVFWLEARFDNNIAKKQNQAGDWKI